MFYMLASMGDQFPLLNVFRSITFRALGATLTALSFVFLFGPPMIGLLRWHQRRGQPIRPDGPQSHILTKQGTPTMGGLMILISLVLTTLLWADLNNSYVWCVMFISLGYGVIGFCDDYIKIIHFSERGLSGKSRIFFESIIALLGIYGMIYMANGQFDMSLSIPVFKDIVLPLGYFFPVFSLLVIVGAGNAVNLTDGLDGLAIVPVIVAAASFGCIAYLAGDRIFSEYLQISHVIGTGELAVICGAIIGAGLGFLWFNAPPAMIFMGDTGSLALGGALGFIAVATKHELVFAIIGGLFVIEAVSVVIQIISFKLTRKRVFLMAPLHHHFEQKGWSETTIVVRFWIISIVLAIIGLVTLKLR